VSAAETQPDALTWRVHPARERLWTALLTLLVVAAASWLTVEAMGNSWWGALAAGFFLVTLHRFFLPSRFRIDADGVTARSAFTSATFRWSDIRRFQHDRRGAFLSTRRRPSFLDAFQGMHLVFRGNGDDVVRRIESRIRTPESTPEVAP
jgi:Bacterial PH domain